MKQDIIDHRIALEKKRLEDVEKRVAEVRQSWNDSAERLWSRKNFKRKKRLAKYGSKEVWKEKWIYRQMKPTRKKIRQGIPISLSDFYEVPYPKRISEAEIQASLWSVLRKHELDIRLEVVHLSRHDLTKRRQVSRFDCVIYKDKKAEIIIEVKRQGKTMNTETRQYQKYSKYNAKLIYCCGAKEIDQTVEKVLSMLY